MVDCYGMSTKTHPHHGLHHPLQGGGLTGRYSPPYGRPLNSDHPMRRMVNTGGNIFGGLDDSFLARAEALSDMNKGSSPPLIKPDLLYGNHDMNTAATPGGRQMQFHGLPPEGSMLDQMSAAASMSISNMAMDHPGVTSHPHSQHMYSSVYAHSGQTMMNGHHPGMPPHGMHDIDCDPRELEAFAERFKQRRIKLGVTQADVGNALGNLKLPGVGSLSQSTICRFESLTLSHNNMIALKPVLAAWLDEAEQKHREVKAHGDQFDANEKKRKRTSIAAPEKRSLEAYFAVQPRPSSEKIAQIAEKLDLKKNVVRVWFCNQRQKQKRLKFSAINQH